jgi:hypothetical protein
LARKKPVLTEETLEALLEKKIGASRSYNVPFINSNAMTEDIAQFVQQRLPIIIFP